MTSDPIGMLSNYSIILYIYLVLKYVLIFGVFFLSIIMITSFRNQSNLFIISFCTYFEKKFTLDLFLFYQQ